MKALVTGGGGFLGGAIVRRLVDRGWTVHTLQRGIYPKLDELGVEQLQGDIAEPDTVSRAVEGCDIVFHVAAKVEPWGAFKPFHQTNVIGTENVLEAMRINGVPKLVFTSTPSVIHKKGDLAGVDESEPYPAHFDAAYPQTKAIAEIAVLAANDAALSTIALRPRLIWGPEDGNLVPQLVARARAGLIRLELIAYRAPLTQVLALDRPPPPTPAPAPPRPANAEQARAHLRRLRHYLTGSIDS